MTRAVALALFVVLPHVLAHADANGAYARERRVAHLASALDGLTALGDGGRRAFEDAIYQTIRATCRPQNRPAPIACSIAAARAACKSSPAVIGERCLAVADVVITNQHAERALLDEATRMRLVRESADYHKAVLAALEARWAVLAAELALVAPDRSLAERIDQLCRDRDREARPCPAAEANGTTATNRGAPSCVGTIAYQRCAAGLVWFTSGPRSKP